MSDTLACDVCNWATSDTPPYTVLQSFGPIQYQVYTHANVYVLCTCARALVGKRYSARAGTPCAALARMVCFVGRCRNTRVFVSVCMYVMMRCSVTLPDPSQTIPTEPYVRTCSTGVLYTTDLPLLVAVAMAMCWPAMAALMARAWWRKRRVTPGSRR